MSTKRWNAYLTLMRLGGSLFAAELNQLSMRQIASHPEIRFDLWIMKQFQVLPTDPRYLSLTQEQRDLLWEGFLLDHPEIEKKMEQTMQDDDFEQAYQALEDSGVMKAENTSEIIHNFQQFVDIQSDDWEEITWDES
ncbi:hypothetical protein IC620_09520 [Hazenella sp. IB182357]|uniref:Uncharacterized protein n=1 Tax=Polycladospora coralii TaxID=2771432 RepID=A0A926N9Z7_9BACL|nr:hypothetical protein [Polycladospora coralii]MBD1372592.1 hypothetical protein [Polycladospora coralii]